MYEAFYGLTEKPFNLTPDPRFLYLSEKHKEAFAHLLFGIKNRSGFILVSGEIGTGKTTICRTLLSQLDPDTEVAFIFNPSLSPDELLRKINEDFGMETRAQSVKGLIDELNAYLLERNSKGKNCVLVIDEAQNLTPSVLEQIRMLSNLETETQKLLQIVLIGQPELNELLSLDELRQLDQRITARYHLKPLDESETLQYIAYRLRVAGGRRKVQFTRGAVKFVFRKSGGVPRVINAICDRSLLIGYTQETHEISKAIAKRAAHEVRGDSVQRRRRRAIKWAAFLPNPTVIAVAILLLVGGKYLVDHVTAMPATVPPLRVRTDVPEPTAPPPLDPAAETAANDSSPAVTPPEMNPAPSESVADAVASAPDVKDLVDDLEPVLSSNAAAVEVLRRWQVPLQGDYPESDSLAGLAAFARQNGLSHEAFFPTLDQLVTLDLPVLTKIAGSRRAVWVALVEVDDDSVRFTTGVGESVLVPRSEFEKRYLNQALALWRDPTPNAGVLRQGMKSGAVRGLQERLGDAGRFDGEATGVYDEMTVAAVRRLQMDTGLNADGVAGRQTRMVLCSWSPAVETPSLAGIDEPAPAQDEPAEAVGEAVQAVNEPAEAPAPESDEAESAPTAPETDEAAVVEPVTPAAPPAPVVPATEGETLVVSETLPPTPVPSTEATSSGEQPE
ncbi:MAG: AAA family ATPase [bacterium]|nr:AAA family ATPase [bacterium]